MFPLNKVEAFDSSYTDTRKADDISLNETKFVYQNTEIDTETLANVSSDLDAPASMRVCRVCLAMNVRMYHISEHEQRVMYERVTGLEITSEDRLPQRLCWECVARLSSANHFIQKAIKTQRIMLDEINDGRFITINDIKSIEKVHVELKSTLSPKFYKVNHSNLHIIKEAIDAEIINECDVQKISELVNKEDRETKFDVNNEEEQIFLTEVDICYENDPIKNEPVDENENKEAIDDCYAFTYKDVDAVKYDIKSEDADISKMIIIKKEHDISSDESFDDETRHQMSQEDSEMVDESNKVLKQRCKMKNSSIQLRNRRSKVLSRRKKDIGVSKYKTRESSKRLTANAQSTLEDENECDSSIDEKNIIDEDMVESSMEKKPKYKRKIKNSILTDTECLKLYLCDICGRPFQYKSALTRHILKHPKLYTCNFCTYKTYRKIDLNRHINNKHTKNTVFDCPYCDYKAYRKTSLDQHITYKHTKNNVFNCSYCSYETPYKQQFSQHINSKHTKDTVFNCSFCDYKTYRKGTLDQHINAKHTKSASFDCSYCSFKTFQKGNLSQHVNTKHTKESVFSCSYCGFKTCQKANLNQHVNAKHTKTTSFNCPHCSYKTYDKSNIKKHINKHTKSTSYDCSYCSYKTYYKCDLNKHIRVKHS